MDAPAFLLLLLCPALARSQYSLGKGRAGQGRVGQGRAGQGRAGQGRVGQGRAGQGSICEGPNLNRPAQAFELVQAHLAATGMLIPSTCTTPHRMYCVHAAKPTGDRQKLS